jgi:hypothetical protein
VFLSPNIEAGAERRVLLKFRMSNFKSRTVGAGGHPKSKVENGNWKIENRQSLVEKEIRN